MANQSKRGLIKEKMSKVINGGKTVGKMAGKVLTAPFSVATDMGNAMSGDVINAIKQKEQVGKVVRQQMMKEGGWGSGVDAQDEHAKRVNNIMGAINKKLNNKSLTGGLIKRYLGIKQ